MKRILSVMLVLAMATTVIPSTISAKASAENWGADYDTTKEFTISNKEELVAFRDMVNGGKSFYGKTVTLNADIDLNSEEWIPIGTQAKQFSGSFQGNHKTIRNLSITNKELDYAGFFGKTGDGSGAVIADLTLENVSIDAHQMVGALGGYMVTRTENCHVTGDLNINGTFMVGGLAGDHYSTIINSHVSGNEGSSINGIYVKSDNEGDNVGGLVGLRGEDVNLIQDCSVSNVKITGTRKLGGLIGAAFLSNNIENCRVSNVTIETNANFGYALLSTSSMGLGGLVGVFNSYTTTGHISSSIISDITFIIPENITKQVKAGYMFGVSRASGAKTPDLTDNLVTGTNTGSNNAKDNVSGVVVHYAKLEPTCTEDGHIEYWRMVDIYYKDALRTEEITEDETILKTTGHDIVKIEEKAPSCTEEGNEEYWHCEKCDEYYGDEALTTQINREDVMISPTGHKVIKVESKAPTCSEEGNIAYWYCEECHKYFADATQNIEITWEDIVIETIDHQELELLHVKQASCTEEGYTGDLVCKACKEIIKKGKILPKLAHQYVDGECSVCGEKDPNYTLQIPELPNKEEQTEQEKAEKENSPQTGDETNPSIWFALMMIASIFGMVSISKKKQETKA